MKKQFKSILLILGALFSATDASIFTMAAMNL